MRGLEATKVVSKVVSRCSQQAGTDHLNTLFLMQQISLDYE